MWSASVYHMHYMELLTSGEAANRLGVHRNTVSRLVDRGLMYPAALVNTARNGSYLFAPAEVERVREQREAGIK